MILLDRPLWPAHGTLWSHLVSDVSLGELHAFARVNGVRRQAFDVDHYDVPAESYERLISAGAEPVSNRDLVVRLAGSGLRVSQRERRAQRERPTTS